VTRGCTVATGTCFAPRAEGCAERDLFEIYACEKTIVQVIPVFPVDPNSKSRGKKTDKETKQKKGKKEPGGEIIKGSPQEKI